MSLARPDPARWLWQAFGGPVWLTLQSLSIGLIVAVYYSFSYAEENTDSRVGSYCYPPKYAGHLPHRDRVQQQAQQRYDASWRQ